MHSSKVYTKLSERLGLEDHLGVLHVMLTDVAKCLRVYGDSEEVVHLALGLFQVQGASKRGCVGILSWICLWGGLV